MIKPVVSYIYRGFQLVVSAACVGISAKLEHDSIRTSPQVNFMLATGAISMLYLLMVMSLPILLPILARAGVFMVLDFCFAALWVGSLGVAVDLFGECTPYVQGAQLAGVSTACQLGKAQMALSAAMFALFVVSFVLIVFFSVMPISNTYGFAALFAKLEFFNGGLFLSRADGWSDDIHPRDDVYIDFNVGSDYDDKIMSPRIENSSGPVPLHALAVDSTNHHLRGVELEDLSRELTGIHRLPVPANLPYPVAMSAHYGD